MKYSQGIYVVEARRSPIGRLGGALAGVSAPQLAVEVARAVLPEQSAARVGAVIMGQGLQAGSGMNLARQVALGAGCPATTPAFTVNMVCGSGLQAVALGAQNIALGQSQVVLTGGAESMSQAPHYVRLRGAHKLGHQQLEDAILTDGLTDALHRVSMGQTAETLAQRYGISRQEQDEFAARSHGLAVAARESFAREIVPIRLGAEAMAADEGPRPDSSLEKLGRLKPAFAGDGTVTAGNASGLNDGAACLLLAGQEALQEQGWLPRARVVATAVSGCDPLLMGLGPVDAIAGVLAEANWSLGEVDAVEINEAFSAQTLACVKELGLSQHKLNQRGGAIALGHPIGASGARVLVTLLHLMEDMDYKTGIAALCVGGGMGIAIAIERTAL